MIAALLEAAGLQGAVLKGALIKAVAAVVLTLSGLLLAGHGLWIAAKAELAQVLLERAWAATLAHPGEPQPPWPWADTWPVARLRVPARGVDLVVLAGASGRTLAFAPGHIDGTAAPGSEGHVALAGHRDTHFRFLEDLEPGDELLLETPEASLRYRVLETRVVDKADAWILAPTEGPTLTLVTCWPFDAVVPGGPERFVVVGVAKGS